jgi:ribosomal protein L11 methyltransferase
MEWVEIVVESCPEREDHVQNVLYSVGATGLAIEDPNDIIELSKSESDWDFIDLELLELDKDVLTIKAYFQQTKGVEEKIAYIRKNIPNCIVNVNQIDPTEWEESYKKYYKPFKIGKDIIIKPSWEEYKKEEGNLIIHLDPGMAFGTGTHETTRMCTEALEEHLKEGDLVYDIGCGSGILSIVSAKLGASKVIGVDLDSNSVRVATENVKINNVEDRVEIFEGNLFNQLNGEADVIAEVIVVMSKDLSGFLKDDGVFIGSGIISDKVSLVEEALKDNNFKIDKVDIQGDWACVVARKN